MEIIVLCGIYAVELACYRIGLELIFDVKFKLGIWSVIGMGLTIVLGMLPIIAVGRNVMTTIAVMITVYFSFREKGMEKIAKIIFLSIFFGCVEDIFLGLSRKIIYVTEVTTILNNMIYFCMKICTAVCLGISLYLKRKFQIKRLAHISAYVYLGLGVTASAMMYCVAVLDYAKPYLKNTKYDLLCDILEIAIYISILLMVIFVIYIKNTNERTERLLKTEKLLKESQVYYYQQLLRKEEDTRKYRHDMMNHLVCIRNFLYRERLEDAKRYVSEILGDFRSIQSTYYVTGNELVDAIMNYFFGMLEKEVKISIHGKTPVELAASDTDICTIFSNLFQNAVEELTEHELLNPEISIYVAKGREYAEYIISNTRAETGEQKVDERGELPRTRKLNQENHGIGLANVKSAVERNGGKFFWRAEGNRFETRVVLPLKKTV